MSRNAVGVLLLLGLSLIYLPGTSLVTDNGVSQGTVPNPTDTPRPTSTSSGPPPTVVPSLTSPPPSPSPVNPTSTSQSVPTATGPTPTLTSGFLPTAAACSTSPTIQAIDSADVRDGPGPRYQTVTTLTPLEVRPIVGRAPEAAWWLIELDSGEIGWIYDGDVQVHGYTGSIPIANVPALGNQTPTPGAPWNPTPDPSCVVTPTTTSTDTATPEGITPQTNGAYPAGSETGTPNSGPPNSENGIALNATENALASGTSRPLASGQEPPNAAGQVETPESDTLANSGSGVLQAPTAAPFLDYRPTSSSDYLLFFGLLLLLVGIILALWRRREVRQKD